MAQRRGDRAPFAYWERWQEDDGAPVDSRASHARLDFFWIANWLFLPLAMDRDAAKEARKQAEALGLTEAWQQWSQAEDASHVRPQHAFIQLWLDTQHKVAHGHS